MIGLLPTGQMMVADVAKRWKAQYFRQAWGDEAPRWQDCSRGSEAIFVQLAVLQPTATPADVAAIIGNDGWTGHRCDECEVQEQGIAVELSHSYESRDRFVLCLKCVEKITQYVEGIRAGLGASK